MNRTGKRSKKILIIDDEPDIGLYLAAAVEDNGYQSLSAESGRPVFDLLFREKPDLIVMDIMMPLKSGISIYKDIRSSKEFRNIPIILISGMAGADDFMENGFRKMIRDETIPLPDGFLEKPIDIKRLLTRIDELA